MAQLRECEGYSGQPRLRSRDAEPPIVVEPDAVRHAADVTNVIDAATSPMSARSGMVADVGAEPAQQGRFSAPLSPAMPATSPLKTFRSTSSPRMPAWRYQSHRLPVGAHRIHCGLAVTSI